MRLVMRVIAVVINGQSQELVYACIDSDRKQTPTVKLGFHSNAIACVACVA